MVVPGAGMELDGFFFVRLSGYLAIGLSGLRAPASCCSVSGEGDEEARRSAVDEPDFAVLVVDVACEGNSL